MANEKLNLIDRGALLRDNEEYFCKPCKEKGHDYHEVACRACWVDDMRIAIEDAPTVDAIPVSWLEEKLKGHPELRYATTDGICEVLRLWASRKMDGDGNA